MRIKWHYWLIILTVIGFLVYLSWIKFYFERKPHRDIPHDENVFVSPANGIVGAVKHWDADSLIITKEENGAVKVFTDEIGESGWFISIIMNIDNVHVQRAPIKSTFIKNIHREGEFESAIVMTNEYGVRFENENNTMLFKTYRGDLYKVIQIAGFRARRIINYLDPNSPVEQGDEIGMITLGSQVTVILPENVIPLVKEGDELIDGETLIARYK